MLDSEKYKTKSYTHFDHKVNIDKVESYVTNQNKIAKHSFLPFIKYTTSFDRNIGIANPKLNNRPIKIKDRDIMYAGHLDNFIYKYYAEQLNVKYNYFAQQHKIDDCSIAYRDNKVGQSNIEFAAEVINKIVSYNTAYILVGDFSNFFDNIDHKLLKDRLLMTLETDRLCNDWYNVFRSITKFGYYKKTFITEQLKKEGKFHNQFCEINKKSYFRGVSKFREFQRLYPCEKNEKFCGIPQGSAISAVLANVYATDFDIKMRTISERYNGTYKRYSDDFILIIPKNYGNNEISLEEIKDIEMTVRNVAKNNKIEIQEEKTELLEYRQEKISNLRNLEKNHLDYLGFIFDGDTVKMRGKSPYKFYRQAYKLIDRATKVKNKKIYPKFHTENNYMAYIPI